MNKEIKEGFTLLTKGPTRVNLVKGKIEVFGKVITPNQEKKISDLNQIEEENVLIIPSATQYPIYALETSELEIYTSKPEENLELIEEHSIPEEWINLKDSVIRYMQKNDDEFPIKIMVLGISSGKTTLIKYLANKLLAEGLKGGYLDSDLGQQIMHLPTTINIGEIKNPIVTSEDIETEHTFFIGATFPKGNLKFILPHASNKLINQYLDNHDETDFILIDSDGWIKTEAGVIYKSFFIKKVNPDILIIFEDDEVEELKEIEKVAKSRKKRKLFTLKDDNIHYYDKSKDERRFLRQSQFAKVLEKYRKITIPLDEIKFIKYDFDKDNDDIIETEIKLNDLIGLPYHYVLIALLDENSEIIKIGLLFSINIEKDYILFFSDLNYKEQIRVKKILLGSLRLSTKGNHQGYLYL